MKKSRIILLVTMLLLVASTCTVWGTTRTVREERRGDTYTEFVGGQEARLCAVGTSSAAYTTMINTSSEQANRQLNAYISEYSYAEMDWTATKTNGSYVATGDSVNSGSITRNMNSYVVEYHHEAISALSPYQPQAIDDLTFIADQYYD